MLKKIQACRSINKSTERRPRAPHSYQSAIVRHSFHHCSSHYNLSLRAGLGMYRKLRFTFFRSVNRETKLVLTQYSDLNCLANGPCYRCHSSDFINSLTSCFDSVANIFPDFQFQYAIEFTDMFHLDSIFKFLRIFTRSNLRLISKKYPAIKSCLSKYNF